MPVSAGERGSGWAMAWAALPGGGVRGAADGCPGIPAGGLGLGDCGVFSRKSGGFWPDSGWALGLDLGLGRSLLRGKIEARATGICAGWERVSGRQRPGKRWGRRDRTAGLRLVQQTQTSRSRPAGPDPLVQFGLNRAHSFRLCTAGQVFCRTGSRTGPNRVDPGSRQRLPQPKSDSE